MVPVVMGVDDGGKVFDVVGRKRGFYGWCHLRGVGWIDDNSVFCGFIGDEVGIVVGAANP